MVDQKLKNNGHYKEVEFCRICGNREFDPVLDLGEQVLSGIFPASKKEIIPVTPLEVIKCSGSTTNDACGLVQLRHSADVEQMYGTTYGYYSSLSPTMVDHLQEILVKLSKYRDLEEGDAVLDIGCNDGTLLNQIKKSNITKVGIDPSSMKFQEKFDERTLLIPEYFSVDAVRKHAGNIQFKQVTAIAMFYDLDQPLAFFQDIKSLLADDGVWAIELAYLPSMLEYLIYDQICHEHVTYPSLTQIEWLAHRAGLQILDVEFNNVNGGSFFVVGSGSKSASRPNQDKIRQILIDEEPLKTSGPYELFNRRVLEHSQEISKFLRDVKAKGKTVIGYGASTKGNIVLNHCDVDEHLIEMIADENPEKWGRVTPGSRITIIPKRQMRDLKPDYLFVLIWHFYAEVLTDEREYIMNGGRIVFGLPRLHIVDKHNYEERLRSGFEEFKFNATN
jgi:NDP-4-keto-2,6-dideoxyhexose 3-C-methyltransferase